MGTVQAACEYVMLVRLSVPIPVDQQRYPPGSRLGKEDLATRRHRHPPGMRKALGKAVGGEAVRHIRRNERP